MMYGTVCGRLGRDAKAVGEQGCALAIASERWTKDGDKTTWVDVLVWGKRAEWALKLKKGDTVLCSGEVYSEEYEKDGVKRTSLKMFASTCNYTPGKKGSE